MIKLPDVTSLYVIICFTIAYAILKRYLFGPLGAILDERDREEKEAAALHAETLARLQKAMTEAEQKLSLARREALKTRESLRAEGRSRLEARLAEASAAAAASIETASGRIQRIAGQLGDLIGDRARSLARDLAEKILGRKLAA
ncbi:MAG: ATP synthase F0 subunit B [Acidobacteriota bacterium]